MNTFGRNFRLTDFGESHSQALGGVIDGVPAGLKFDYALLGELMARRKPGQPMTTPRNEADEVEILSGISPEGVTYGTPIGFIIRNKDMRPQDYDQSDNRGFRPNHADYTYHCRYDGHEARSGGGRASARQTATRVVAGAVAMMILRQYGVEVISELLFPTQEELKRAIEQKDSIGGLVRCSITGMKPGIGEPVYGKLQAKLAEAMLGINAVKGFDYGIGIDTINSLGSAQRDLFNPDFTTRTNFSGGIQGGISNGMPIEFRVWFKPTPTIPQDCETVNAAGEVVPLKFKGRHDPCVAIRGQVVVEAMAAMVIADFLV